MPQKARTIADQTWDELEGVEWGPPAYDSSLVTNVHRLRRAPLKQYRLEDLRLMISQQVGVNHLVPRALDHLEADPLASGDFYPSDLLASVARLPDAFWSTHQQSIPRALRAIDAALAGVWAYCPCWHLLARGRATRSGVAGGQTTTHGKLPAARTVRVIRERPGARPGVECWSVIRHEVGDPMKITVETVVDAPLDVVWRAWSSPEDIKQWNAASDDWHTTRAAVDLRVGGAFSSRMEAKDGSAGFDFAGTYTKVLPGKLIECTFGDRVLVVEFLERADGVAVRETFDAEDTHPVEQQRAGWQAILDRFARHVRATK